MESLFEYVKLLSERQLPISAVIQFQNYWKTKNPNFSIPNFATLKLICDYDNVSILHDGMAYYVIDTEDRCIEMSTSMENIKTELKSSKTVIL